MKARDHIQPLKRAEQRVASRGVVRVGLLDVTNQLAGEARSDTVGFGLLRHGGHSRREPRHTTAPRSRLRFARRAGALANDLKVPDIS